jgi:hypothetical protein
MVFFGVNVNADGGETFVVSRQWWLFLEITLPLTLTVFGIWIAWQWRRAHAIAVGRESSSGQQTSQT